MARVTVEDCIKKVKNRFELVLIAAQRAKELSDGAELNVERDNDKNPVVALREIAEDKVDVQSIREKIISNFREVDDTDHSEDELDANLDKTIGVEKEIAAASISPIDLEEIMKDAEGLDGSVEEISNDLASDSFEDQVGMDISDDIDIDSDSEDKSDSDMIG